MDSANIPALTLREDVIVIVDVENQIGAMLVRQRNAFIVDETGVFD
jgi:hypothetical protein